MTVLTGALLKNVANISNNPSATINDITKGGQLGIGPRLPKIDAATPLVFAPAVPIITHVPTMFNKVPQMKSILKALVERHSKTITGVDFGYEMDEGSAYILADGQEAKIPTKNKRTAISPNMTFAEIQGNLVWNFFRQWMTMISSPDTHFSSLASMTNDASLDPFVYSYFCMDMLLINFDPTMLPQNIIDAVFITTMWPKTTGQLGVKREVATTDGGVERSIDFNGIVQHNSAVYKAAVNIARVLGLHKADFRYATPVASTIEQGLTNTGLQGEISEILSAFRLT
jgi:hypothetical protein